MPTYGYKCDQCGQELEAFQRMSDAPLRTCPACGAEALRRQFFPAGVLFKGSGFYKTDYAPKGGGSASNGGSEKSSDSSSKPNSGSSESKGSSEKASSASD